MADQVFIVNIAKKGEHMKVLGLTGGIASGKSFAANYLKQKGYTVIDADSITKTLLEDKVVLSEIKAYFQSAFVNGRLDKKILSQIIFDNKKDKEMLESIIHPLVYKRIVTELENHQDEPWVIVDVPLLFETFRTNLYDQVMVIYVDDKTQLERLMLRDKISKETAKKRIDSQMSLTEKKKKADIVIDNTRTIYDTQKQLDKVIERLV